MAERVSLNVKNSPALRQISYESGLDRLHPPQSQGTSKKPPMEGLGEVRCRANRIVEKTAKQWEIT